MIVSSFKTNDFVLKSNKFCFNSSPIYHFVMSKKRFQNLDQDIIRQHIDFLLDIIPKNILKFCGTNK